MSSERLDELFRIKITGEPDAVERAHFYLGLGYFSQLWATLELHFDLCIVVIYHYARGGKSLDRVQPMSLSRKLTYFRRAHRKLDQLKEYVDAAETIAKSLEMLGSQRNKIIHGAAKSTGTPYQRELGRILPHAERMHFETEQIDWKDMLAATAATGILIGPLLAYSVMLFEIFANEPD